MTPLYGHTSEDTAYVVDSYPYGGLRCRIKFWIEQHPTRGFRFVSQTENPKTLRWNNPKKSQYSLLGECLYLDENNHVKAKALTEYSGVKDILEYLENFPDAPISNNLTAFVLRSKQIIARTARGEAIISIGGVPQKPNVSDIEKASQELLILDKCLEIIKNK